MSTPPTPPALVAIFAFDTSNQLAVRQLGSKAGLPIHPGAIAGVPLVLAAIILWQRFSRPVARADADTWAKEPKRKP